MKTTVFVFGVSGSGKTLSSQKLAHALNADYLEVDRIGLLGQKLLGKRIDVSNLAKWDGDGMIARTRKLIADAATRNPPSPDIPPLRTHRPGVRTETLVAEGYWLGRRRLRKLIQDAYHPGSRTISLLLKPPFPFMKKSWDERKWNLTQQVYHEKFALMEVDPETYVLNHPRQVLCDFSPRYQTKTVDVRKKVALLGLDGEVRNHTVVDLGSNAGYYCRHYKRLGARRVVGIDTCWRALDWAKGQEPNLPIEYKLGTFDNLPTGNQTFDYVLLLASLWYSRDQAALLESLGKITRKAALVEIIIGPAGRRGLKVARRGPPYNDVIPTVEWVQKHLAQGGLGRIRNLGQCPSPDKTEREILRCERG